MSYDTHEFCKRDYERQTATIDRLIKEKVAVKFALEKAHAKEVRELEAKIRDLEFEVECLNETIEDERKAQERDRRY